MKKIVLLVAMGLLISVSTFAQRSNRTKAYMYMEKGKLEEAKAAIDEAVKNPKTMNDAKTWLYYGRVYYGIASSPLPAFRKLDSLAAEKAMAGLQKAKKLDDKRRIDKEADEYLGKLSTVFYQQGSRAYKERNYGGAAKNFADAYHVAKQLGKVDTTAAFNAGISAVLAHNPKMASNYLKKSIDAGYADPKAYVFYARSLKEMGDTIAAEKALKTGRKVHPDDLGLLLEQAQVYLEKGQSKELINSLKQAIAKEPNSPNNANLYFLIGKSYDDLKDLGKAEDNYKKALKVNPNFFEAYYNIGAIYVNKASVLQKEANNLPLSEDKKYKKLNDSANANLEIAVPWLEKALKLKPTDQATVKALKEAYTRLKMNNKLKELMKK